MELVIRARKARPSLFFKKVEGVAVSIGKTPSKITALSSGEKEVDLHSYKPCNEIPLPPPEPNGRDKAKLIEIVKGMIPEATYTESWYNFIEQLVKRKLEGFMGFTSSRNMCVSYLGEMHLADEGEVDYKYAHNLFPIVDKDFKIKNLSYESILDLYESLADENIVLYCEDFSIKDITEELQSWLLLDYSTNIRYRLSVVKSIVGTKEFLRGYGIKSEVKEGLVLIKKNRDEKKGSTPRPW